MIRTQLYLPEDTHLDLHLLAQREKKRVSQIVREILNEGIKRKRQVSSGKTLLKIARYGFSNGPKDLSSNIDSYLYGGKK